MSTRVVHYSNQDSSGTVKDRWWLEPAGEKHSHVSAIVKRIKQAQSSRHQRNLFMAQMYENEEVAGFGAGLYTSQITQSAQTRRITFNVIKSCTDTLVSRLGTAKPKPMAITEDGNWAQRNRAEKLTDYLEGLYQQIGLWKEGRLALRDACVLGTGVLKLHNSSGKVGVDRIIIDEIMVDEVEAIYGQPRQMHQARFINRDVVKGMFPGMEKEIDACPSGVDPIVMNAKTADMIMIIESWHLPSFVGATDGVHCVTINNATLFEEPWKRSWFPFLFYRYTDRLLGFYGRSLAEEIVGIQLEMNKMLRTIAISQHLVSVPQVWLDIASKAVTAHIDNEIGGIKYYAGSPPTFTTPSAMPGEYYSHFENLYRKAFEITGLSQLSAQGHKPAGLNSGVALRTVQDIESDRFKWTSQKYDEMYLSAADMVIALNEELFAKDPALQVKVDGNKSMKRLNWKDVRLDVESYTMRLFPTSLLPSTPEGKFQKVQEMLQAGMLEQEEGIQLLDFPDISSVTSRKLAPKEIVFKILGKIVEYGIYESPEPYMDLVVAKSIAQNIYLDSRVKDVPQNRLDLILTFISDCDALQDEAAAQAQEEQMNMQGGMGMDPNAAMDPNMPLGAPAPLPTSDLMPMQ